MTTPSPHRVGSSHVDGAVRRAGKGYPCMYSSNVGGEDKNKYYKTNTGRDQEKEVNFQNEHMAEKRSCEFFDNPIWLSTKDAAIYLRKFRKDGAPSAGAIRTAIWRKEIRAKKWRGRLYILRRDLDRSLQNSPFASGGFRWA